MLERGHHPCRSPPIASLPEQSRRLLQRLGGLGEAAGMEGSLPEPSQRRGAFRVSVWGEG